MKIRLVVFLAVFPFSMWLMEWLVRWLANNSDAKTFLGPAIASAALGLIAPVAIPRVDPVTGGAAFRRDVNVTYAGVLGIAFGVVAWCFCLALSMKRDLPTGMLSLMKAEWWQFGVAILMYLVAVILTLWKEGV